MPRTLKEYPLILRPYVFHGVRLNWDKGKQAIGDCPWCGRERKFAVEIETGRWRCFVCAEGSKRGGGNVYTFIRHLWKRSDEATTDYLSLVQDRGLSYPETLMQWGIARSILTGDWIVPGYTADGLLQQLYRYVGTTKKRLLATPTLKHQMFGVNLFDKSKSMVFLCEGPWDAMVLWEALGKAKQGETKLLSTANINSSLRASANVLAVPGCSVSDSFKQFLPLFAGKDVSLMFDSDHPREGPKTKQPLEPAGLAGMKRAARMLSEALNPPASISFLQWGELGYDAGKPSGYDVRDYLTNPPSEL